MDRIEWKTKNLIVKSHRAAKMFEYSVKMSLLYNDDDHSEENQQS